MEVLRARRRLGREGEGDGLSKGRRKERELARRRGAREGVGRFTGKMEDFQVDGRRETGMYAELEKVEKSQIPVEDDVT